MTMYPKMPEAAAGWCGRWRRLTGRQRVILAAALVPVLAVWALLIVRIAAGEPLRPEIYYQTTLQTAASDDLHLVLRLTKNKTSGKVTLANAAAVVSFNNTPPTENGRENYVLETLADGAVIHARKFVFLETIAGLPPEPGTRETTGDAPAVLAAPEAVVEIPYLNSVSLRVRDLKTQKVYPLTSALISRAVSRPRPLPAETALSVYNVAERSYLPLAPTAETGDGYFDILYISEDYTDFTLFAADTRAMADFLLNTAPYAEVNTKIRITRLNNGVDLGCEYDGRLILCDPFLVEQVAEPINHDTIVVVVNNNEYGGAGYWGLMAVTYRNVAEFAREVAIHEMGHSFGWLWDEYDYGATLPEGETPGANCDFPPCPKWLGVPGTGCFPVCGYTDLNRPTDNGCLMRSLSPLGGPIFCPVCQQTLREALSRYTLTTLPTPTPQPTATPTALPVRKVFVSSLVFTGNLGGLAGADGQCQQLARIAGLDGQFIAWLSDHNLATGETVNVRDRLPEAKYVLVTGEVIADNKWDLLEDWTLDHPINVNEKGEPVLYYKYVWTGSKPGGWIAGYSETDKPICRDTTAGDVTGWQNSDGDPVFGMTGNLDYADAKWSYYVGNECLTRNRLYCFQVAD